MADEGRRSEAVAIPPATFANVAQISHTNHEFYLEFGQFSGQIERRGEPQPLLQIQLVARLVLTPQHVRELIRALEQNVTQYEASYGPIEVKPLKVGSGVVQ